MKAIKHKLNSNQGISLLFAIVLVLVAALVVSVCLSAAISSMKGVYSQKTEQQGYLAAYSASQLMGTNLQDAEYTITVANSTDSIVGAGAAATGGFSSLLTEAVTYVEQYQKAFSKTMTVTAKVDNQTQEKLTVKVSFKMDTDYKISAGFVSENGLEAYPVYMQLSGAKTVEGTEYTLSNGKKATKYVVTIKWGTPTYTQTEG